MSHGHWQSQYQRRLVVYDLPLPYWWLPGDPLYFCFSEVLVYLVLDLFSAHARQLAEASSPLEEHCVSPRK